MLRNLFRPLGFLLVCAAPFAVMGPAGCADNKSTIFVKHVLAPTDDCSFEADPTAPALFYGLMDLAVTDTYTAVLLVGNQLVPQGEDDQLRTETSRVALQGAEVRLDAIGGDTVAHFRTIVSSTVDPAAGPEPGYGWANVTLVPPGLGLAPGEYVATVTVFGETLGNQDVETGEFSFVIRVCDQCLVTYSPEALTLGACRPPAGELVVPCFPGQDVLVDCTFCRDRSSCVPPPVAP